MITIPYPSLHEVDLAAERRAAAYEAARRQIDPSDVLAVTMERLLESPHDADHPLWPLVQCLMHGHPTAEPGHHISLCAAVGAAFEPLIAEAIADLAMQALIADSAWEG